MTSPPIGTDEELIVRLRKYGHIEAADALLSRISEVERLRETVELIANAPDWATVSWCKSQARLACSGKRKGLERCSTCGGEFDQGEWDASAECPECETPKEAQ